MRGPLTYLAVVLSLLGQNFRSRLFGFPLRRGLTNLQAALIIVTIIVIGIIIIYLLLTLSFTPPYP